MTAQEQIDLIRNETVAGANTRVRVADALQAIFNAQIPPILLSNTFWVNLGLTENNIVNRIFKSWLDAKDWIFANANPSESNLCQICLPAGNVGDVVLCEGIRLSVTDGTIIENLSSSVTFDGDYNTVLKAYLAGAQINNLDLQGDGKCCGLYNCVVNNVIAATSTVIYVANDCQFLAGDFENYEGFQSKCKYSPILGDINNLSSTSDYNEINLVDGYEFELNCVDIKGRFLTVKVTSISGKLKVNNCSCGDVSLSTDSQIINSAMGDITGTGTANITVKNSNIGDITLEDTATLTHENSIIGTATVASGATLTRISEPFNSAGTGLTSTTMQDVIVELKALIDAI